MSLLQGVEVFGLAVILTLILWFGTKDNEGGQLGPLKWHWIVVLSLLAGAAYRVVNGFPFNLITGLVNDALGLIGAAVPELTLPALGGCLLVLLAFRKNTRRGTAMLCIFLVFVAADSGGVLEPVADRLETVARKLPG